MLVDQQQAVELAGTESRQLGFDSGIGRGTGQTCHTNVPAAWLTLNSEINVSICRPIAGHAQRRRKRRLTVPLRQPNKNPLRRQSLATSLLAQKDGGQGWIRTSVRLRGQIYSLLPLTTRPPVQVLSRADHPGKVEHGEQARQMASARAGVNRAGVGRCAPIVFDASLRSARSKFDSAPGRSRSWSG